MQVSVVIPLFNKAAYIEVAIRSVLAGEVLPLEIIVIDDGSTDASAVLADALPSPLLRVIRQTNAGVSAARNRGISLARGDFIAFLDADDWWEASFLARIESLIDQFPSCAVYATGYARQDEKQQLTFSSRRGLKAANRSSRVDNFFEVWSHGSFFCSSSVAVPRAQFADPALRFPVREGLGEDQDVWFQLAERGDIAFDPRPSATYRIGVANNASQAALPLVHLPYVRRLAGRFRRGELPAQHRNGAARLLGIKQVELARRLAHAGERGRAWAWIKREPSRRAGLYWLRSLLWMCCPAPLLRHLPGGN